MSEPTTMSYNLHRLRVAEIARCISDVIPHDPNDVTCGLILPLDSRLESSIQDLPTFFRLEVAGSEEIKLIDQKHPSIPMQRLLINLMTNLIRCKLHFPYLAGHPSTSLHIFSRNASLTAARRVLSTHTDMTTLNISHSADFMRIQGAVLFLFMGAIVLATDLCCNQLLLEDRDRQMSELMAALKQLDAIRQYSQMARKFLEALTQMLVKYGLWLSDTAVSMTREGDMAPNDDCYTEGHVGVSELDTRFAFDELWETFVEQPSAVDIIDIL